MNTRSFVVGPAFGLTLLVAPTTLATVTIDWVTIGSAGNAADPTTGFGAIGYEYRMSATEVSNAQYTEFLNSVAASDSFGGADPTLYNSNMAGVYGGITRSGSAGSYTYAVVPGRETNPANYTSFIDAMRFTNWLHNGQGAGGTESGVYTITDGWSETRSVGAAYFLPSEDEWYKAAYHQPAALGGDSDDYWQYPTSSNSVPVGGVDANMIGSGVLNTMPVGSYSANFYGLFDLGGNVWEWNEGAFSASLRGLRGGSWDSDEVALRSSNSNSDGPWFEYNYLGFRVGSPVPGPGPAAVMVVGASLLARRRRS